MKSSKIALIFLCFFYMSFAVAEDKASRLTLKGFGTLSGTGTDNDSIGFRRDVSENRGIYNRWNITKDSRFGVQVDAKLTDDINATVQWVARDHAGDFFEQNLEWAFLNWNITSDFNVRAGRLGTDLFIMSDYRNVGYAYPWIRPPHEYYSNIPYYHFDGIDMTKKIDIGGGLLSVKIFGGFALNQLPFSSKVVFNQKSVITGGNALFEKNDWRFKASYAHLDILSEIPFNEFSSNNISVDQFLSPDNIDLLDTVWPGIKGVIPNVYIKGKEIHYTSVGAAYDDGTWLAQAEASYINTNTTWYPDQAASYFSVGRRFSSVTVYSLLGIVGNVSSDVAVPKPPSGISELEDVYLQLNRTINNNKFSEKSLSLGLRWDFYTNMAFKAQWSHYWLGSDSSRAWVYNKSDTYLNQNQINVFSVGVDFIF